MARPLHWAFSLFWRRRDQQLWARSGIKKEEKKSIPSRTATTGCMPEKQQNDDAFFLERLPLEAAAVLFEPLRFGPTRLLPNAYDIVHAANGRLKCFCHIKWQVQPSTAPTPHKGTYHTNKFRPCTMISRLFCIISCMGCVTTSGKFHLLCSF
jgi:hypothetical protein